MAAWKRLVAAQSELWIVLFPALHEEPSESAFRSQATPSSSGFLYKNSHWEKLSEIADLEVPEGCSLQGDGLQ